MSNRTISMTDALYDYLCNASLREPEILKELRTATAKMPNANMQIAPEQGQFMALLVKLMKAHKALEIGTFTGYSSLSVALALPALGEVVCCDMSEEYTAVAQEFWERAGVAEKMDLRLGPALETLDQMIADKNQAGTFDFAFIDADKIEYPEYYERVLTLLRPGGLIVVDNVLRGGRVADPGENDAGTQVMRQFNEDLKNDSRIELSLVPIADGLTLAMKR
ncbi:MAG: class I SAM-dependent methyltransferase [Candidatus Marinimicrobia bacterium]|nr:class I SAM-dependent methyltransferase [Candidatus Neomarinimicrobiota bacterium]MCF7840194.1 class I SAM-dependent methyltransferase [Candidatus Neomarinimicrobiota bacterium]